MNRKSVAILIVITIVLSGAAGFGGTFLANNTAIIPSASYGAQSSAETDRAPVANYELDAEQLNAYLDEYIATHDMTGGSSNDVSHLITTENKPASHELTIPEIAALASNSVVEIYTESVVSSGRMGQFVTEGAGSGVIVSADGYIVTNNHVIEGSSKITVRLRNGTDYEAVLIGRDSKTDLAVVKIDAKGLQPVDYGNSDDLMAGELAVAIGNPLGQLGGSITEGVISALSRSIEIDGTMMTLLQTSAAVNPGNSGGGLFNSRGELIGVVNAKSSGSDIEGIGFAIPANLARTIADALIQYGYIPGRIDFGVIMVDIPDARTAMMYRVSSTGVYVSQADPDSELKAGDRIISVNEKDIHSSADINELLEKQKVGDVLTIVVSRNGENITVHHALKQAKH